MGSFMTAMHPTHEFCTSRGVAAAVLAAVPIVGVGVVGLLVAVALAAPAANLLILNCVSKGGPSTG